MNALPMLFAVFTMAVLIGSLRLNQVAGTIPGVVAGLTLVLLGLQFFRQRLVNGEAKTDQLNPLRRQLDGAALAWLSGLCLAVWLGGLSAGLAAFCLSMLRFQYRESWRFSIVTALLIGLGLQMTFALLGLPLYRGLAHAWLP
jgi:hypothetical protein